MEKQNRKRSFFERLTGSIRAEEDDYEEELQEPARGGKASAVANPAWMEEDNDEAELTVDVYQTPDEIVVQTMVAGVKPEDLEITTTRNMITIRGKREESRMVDEEDYFTKELYWGSFSRTISLPQEVEPEETEATEKNGLLTVKLQKIDKEKRTSVKVKSA
ncbi:MAG TPA: Hsp20/alpha crystallin family protein [Candidatus Paceibacterota bacterium]|nr:Hsp20/alpha crystallin family protein [Candidatus Paceibacterota bacterium]